MDAAEKWYQERMEWLRANGHLTDDKPSKWQKGMWQAIKGAAAVVAALGAGFLSFAMAWQIAVYIGGNNGATVFIFMFGPLALVFGLILISAFCALVTEVTNDGC